ncbi:PTS sugar transporter subunit IIA [Streptococcus merionis]|nr:PTS sugar transporter subunit IIA [Streptococcus merionis]
MLNQHFNSKEDLLVETSKKLEDEGFVTNKFSESLLERERLGSTEFPLGVAIPHGKPSFVNKTFVAVITLITKIKWYESFVDTIFLVGIAKKDMEWTREIVSNIYRFINDKEELKKLKNKKSNKEVVKILYGKN